MAFYGGGLIQKVVPTLLVLGAVGCASVPAVVPAGPENGTFFQEPTSTPRFSATMNARREKLNQAVDAQLTVQFEVLQDLVDSSRDFRDQIAKRQAALRDRFQNDDEVSPHDAELVLEAAHWFIELDAMLYELWVGYRRYLPNGSEPDPYAPFRAATLLSPAVRAKGGLLALTAEMVRMDNAALVVDVLGDELALTHWLNRGDAARSIEPESYDRIVGGLYDPGRRILLKELLASVTAHQEELDLTARDDGQLAFLLATLARSPVAKDLREERGVPRQARFVGVMAERTGAALLGPALDLYIRSFQDAADEGDKRFARLERTDGLAMRIESLLQPFDILVVRDGRRRGAASGYSYAVVYLGRLDQWVQDANQADVTFPVVAAELRQGDRFLELGSDGPRYLGLDQLLLGEALLILRPMATTDRAEHYDVLLETLLEEDISNPPPRPAPDYSAVLLQELFSDAAVGREATMGRLPRLDTALRSMLRTESPVAVILATLKEEVVTGSATADEKSKAALRARVRTSLERTSPVYLEGR